ncbi:hypothetical protein C5F48_13265 [Cereibacter changlensis JA139]|uniref:Helix-turn-helix domain-containing protein n=2 Tax=Cereibacter changlensis TaxID=402884 RepID=A0A2T4JU20_9RHOB|nr:hypothetical protein [Cereibacter changlensis]PTE21263.1 hypothetical protein C5F48_13265 [Cereibacter changlensis JA139]PZX47454.1 hypothetical protein LX76_04517 [Cereibacter changlensis]
MKELRSWVKLPSAWIEAGGLREFQWGKTGGSRQAAALMVLLSVAHHADEATSTARITYDDLHQALGLSRTLISDGLDVLEERKLLVREVKGRSTFALTAYDPKRGWAMLPARPLYTGGSIRAFTDFHLRRKVELDALKSYFAFAARRDSEKNRAHMTYEQLSAYAGIPEGRIKSAISVLIHNNLVVVEQIERPGRLGVSHSYRLTHLHPNRHLGSSDRAGMEYTDAEL